MDYANRYFLVIVIFISVKSTMVSCRVCMQSVLMNLIILVWSLMLDGYFISENRGIKSGLVYCELEGWILPA